MAKRLNHLNWLYDTLDCGFSGCVFRNKNKLFLTGKKGGCQCFSELTAQKKLFVHLMFSTLLRMIEEPPPPIPGKKGQ